MKRVVLAVCLVLFSFVLSFFSYFYVKNVSDKLETVLETALEGNSEDGKVSSENIQIALNVWKKHGNFFGILLKNSTSGEISEAFSEIEFFLNYQQNDSLEQAVSKCIFLLKSTVESEKLSFNNIF